MDNVEDTNSPIFDNIAEGLSAAGYCVQQNAIPLELCNLLWEQLHIKSSTTFQQAGVGRQDKFEVNALVRSDEISWINDATPAGAAWLNWTASLQAFLNAKLFLGLFSFESHFARYQKGDFYAKHQDAFVGQGNRILTVVMYLNKDWGEADAGEMVLYAGENQDVAVNVKPEFGTLAVFLSEEFPHEVLPTNCERYSIAGWFRVNGSKANQIDPPE